MSMIQERNIQVSRSPWERTKILLEMIKFEHTIFALPFAYTGAFLAARGLPDPWTSFWILVAMAGARTVAMGVNRIVDVPFDAKNPRTKGRALVRGDVTPREAWMMVIIAGICYFVAAFNLTTLALELSPFVLATVIFYSYTKRFTALCHIFLGLAIGIAPSAGWIAVRDSLGVIPIALSIGVLFWVAGFDILYACLDANFDRSEGLHSIPAALGVRKAFWVSALFHVVAFLAFLYVGILAQLNWIYYAGIGVTFLLLLTQRMVVRPDDLSRMDMAFFTLNGAISIVVFISTALALLWQH